MKINPINGATGTRLRNLCNQLNRASQILLLLLLASLACHSQDLQCSLKLTNLSQPAEFLGFQLGMTKDQVKARFPHVIFGRTDDFGVSKMTINPHFDSRIDATKFEGVRSISLDFLDERLTSLWIGFDSTFRIKTVDEFVTGISESLRLPDSWKRWRSRGRQINCADFQLTVTMIADGPSVRILDMGAEELLAQRKEAKAEQESAATTNEEGSEIVADKRQKVYYPAGCELAKDVAGSDRLIFKSVAEAENAGFRAASKCK